MKIRLLVFLYACIAYGMEGEIKTISSYEELLRHLAATRSGEQAELDVEPSVFQQVPSEYIKSRCDSRQLIALYRAQEKNPDQYKQTVKALLACTRTWHAPAARNSSSNDLGGSEVTSLSHADSSGNSILSELKEAEESPQEPKEPLAQTELMLLANLIEVLREKIENDAQSSEQQMKYAQEQLEFAKKVHKSGRFWKGVGICVSVTGAIISFLWSVGNGIWSGVNEANMGCDCS